MSLKGQTTFRKEEIEKYIGKSEDGEAYQNFREEVIARMTRYRKPFRFTDRSINYELGSAWDKVVKGCEGIQFDYTINTVKGETRICKVIFKAL